MPYNHPPETYERSLNFLVRVNLETIWDGGPKFKKIAGKPRLPCNSAEEQKTLAIIDQTPRTEHEGRYRPGQERSKKTYSNLTQRSHHDNAATQRKLILRTEPGEI